MGPIKAVGICYVRMLNFSGRARRAEYWWFTLFQILALFGGAAAYGYWIAMRVQSDPAFAQIMQSAGGAEAYFDAQVDQYAVPFVVGCAVLSWIPSLSVAIRRLHDADRSGWWYLINVVPLIGPIWFLVLMCLPGTNDKNTYGGDPVANRAPKEPAHPAFAAELSGEARDRSEVARKAAARDYYKRRVLPSIQKA